MSGAGRNRPWATAAIAVLAIVAFAWPRVPPAWLLERDAVRQGEFWRLWTGHLVHFGASHLLWNLVVFIAVGTWLERVAAMRARIFFAVAPAMISAALLLLVPAMDRYGGLSGLATGALALLAFIELSRETRGGRWWWAVLVLIAVKIAAEFFFQRAVFARLPADEVRVVPLAHLAGMGCAVVVNFTRRPRPRDGEKK